MKTLKYLHYPLFLVLFIFIMEGNAETKTYKVEDSCVSTGMSFEVEKDDTYELTYNGQLTLSECEYNFSPPNNDSKLCIKATVFHILNCDLRVDLSGGNRSSNYSCHNTSVDDFCDPDGGTNLTIIFRNGSNNGQDNIKFEIYVNEESATFPIIVFVVLGCVVGFFSVAFVKVKRRNSKRDSVSPARQDTSTDQTQQHQAASVQTGAPSTHEMTTQYSRPRSSSSCPEPTYEEDRIHKPHPAPQNIYFSYQPPPSGTSVVPVLPVAPSYHNGPPPSYEQAMAAKNMDV